MELSELSPLVRRHVGDINLRCLHGFLGSFTIFEYVDGLGGNSFARSFVFNYLVPLLDYLFIFQILQVLVMKPWDFERHLKLLNFIQLFLELPVFSFDDALENSDLYCCKVFVLCELGSLFLVGFDKITNLHINSHVIPLYDLLHFVFKHLIPKL